MKLRTADGRSYSITQNDLLWIARAAQAEGGNEAATLWTWAWRFMVNANGRGSLAELVRAHSQPVNPAWDSASDPKCIAHPERCGAAALERRAYFSSLPWEQIRGDVRDLVLAWATAQVENPAPRATDFADEQVSRAFLARPGNAGAEVVLRDGNWYIAEARARALPADYVTVEHDGKVAGARKLSPWLAALAGGAAVLAAAGGLAWWSSR